MQLRIALLALTLAPFAWGQETLPPSPPQVVETRIVRLEHVGADTIAHILTGTVRRAIPSVPLKAVALTGTAEELDRAEAQIKLLDEPTARNPEPLTSNVEVMVHYVGADVGSQPIPQDSRLQAVVEQLRANFAYKNYSLLASYMVRASVSPDDRVGARGLLPTLGYEPLDESGEPSLTSDYALEFRLIHLRGAAPNRIAMLRRLSASWRFPVNQLGKVRYEDASIETSVNLPEGKLVVLGKAGLPGSDKGIFLVLEARPVD